MRVIFILIMFMATIGPVFSQTHYKYVVNKGAKEIYILSDSTARAKLKLTLFNTGFTCDIDKEGYWKTTNTVSIGLLPLSLYGSITQTDSGTLIIMKGFVNDSYYSQAIVRTIAGSGLNPTSTSPVEAKGQSGSASFLAFAKMLQVAEKIGSITFQKVKTTQMIRFKQKDIDKL